MFKSYRLAFLSLIVIASGCQHVALLDLHHFGKPAKPVNITDVVVAWEPSEGVGLDGRPTRGFAGQIMFFTNDPRYPEAQPVNGDVSIYVYDDLGTPAQNQEPFHNFEFQKEPFSALGAETNLGYTYQLFVPYTKKNMYQVNCGLRVKLTQADGLPVFSRIASVSLPGAARPSSLPAASVTSQTDPVKWDPQTNSHKLGNGNTYSTTVSSQTVPLNEIFRERLASMADEAVQQTETPRQPRSLPPQRTAQPVVSAETATTSTPSLPAPERHPIELLDN